MRRKNKRLLAFLVIIFCIVFYYYMRATGYGMIVKASPKEIDCTRNTVESVTLLGEYVVVVSEEGLGTQGMASFENNGKIYLFGHAIEEPVGSLAFKVEKSNNEIVLSNLMGEVISNDKSGVIVEEFQKVREYSTIPIAKTAQLGEAFMLERNDEGNICQYPITIEAFSEKNGMFFYSSSEMQLENGISGMPIIQNDKLIGIHYGTAKNGRGIGWIIWSLGSVLS